MQTSFVSVCLNFWKQTKNSTNFCEDPIQILETEVFREGRQQGNYKHRFVTCPSVNKPVERVGRGVGYLGPCDVWGPRRRPEMHIKYATMYHFKEKNSKFFSPEGPRENVWGPCENVSPGLAVAVDGPGVKHYKPFDWLRSTFSPLQYSIFCSLPSVLVRGYVVVNLCSFRPMSGDQRVWEKRALWVKLDKGQIFTCHTNFRPNGTLFISLRLSNDFRMIFCWYFNQQSTVEFSILTKWQWKMKIYFGYVELANKRPDY